jgi:hypothetical protein
LLLQRQVGNQPFQPGILPLEFLEPLGLLDLQTTLLVTPSVVALFGDLGLFARLTDGPSLPNQDIDLPQLGDDLFRALSPLCHLPGSFPR